MINNLLKSPLNYTGGKFKLLSQIIPLFPKNIVTFVDLFGGGANVCVNINAEKIIYNEITSPIVDLFYNLYTEDTINSLEKILNVINEYNCLKTKEDYLRLRADYNLDKSWEKLYVLSCYSFNYFIKFNIKGDFNVPCGKMYNTNIERLLNKIENFSNKMKTKNIKFTNKDYKLFNFDDLTENDFVYADPPYLLSNIHYDNHWNEKEEMQLLKILTELDRRGVKFALSNVIKYRGKENNILINWSKEFYVHKIDIDYKHSWYSNKKIQKGNKDETVEVLITNYKV